MELLRHLRKRFTVGSLWAGMEIARRADAPDTVEALRAMLLTLTRTMAPLRSRLAHNMRCAGVYRKSLVDQHFERAVDQIIMLAHVFRAGFANSGNPERFVFDESFRWLEQAYAAGNGVITIAPHICGYPLYAPIVTPRIPCSIYLRRNSDPRKMAITEAIGRAGEGHLVAPPLGATKAQRLQVAIDVLREGKVLFITPDTPRKPDSGIEVTLFGRQAYFPTGVFVMSARTRAPVVPVVWHWHEGAYRLRYSQPIEVARGGHVKKQTESATRQWAQSVDDFLRAHPAMWWNWLDKRWTQILRSTPAPARVDAA
jgi:lauroyl/myristoyl acyltransferase